MTSLRDIGLVNLLKKIYQRPLSSTLQPLWLTWLLALPALTPLFQPTLTRSADGLLHLYRLIALDQLLRQGVFFPRWWPDLAYGYGLPLFVFYAPLSYYLSEAFHLLGFDFIQATNASAALALLTAAAGAYLLAQDWFGPKAGVLAGLAYVYAPYQLFNIFARGSLPVTWAGALFPLAFWAFGRLLRSNQSRYLPLAALTLAAALLMHNISNLLFLPILVFFLAAAILISHFSHRRWPITLQAMLWVGLGLLLALALATFFWLPATLEREFAQLQRVITPPLFDFRTNFVSLTQLFSLPQPANTGLLNPSDPLTLGLAQVGLALIGLLALVMTTLVAGLKRLKPSRRPNFSARGGSQVGAEFYAAIIPALLLLIALVGAILMMLPISVTIWEGLPLLAFAQQPHRLLSVTALILALLAGAAVTYLPERFHTGFMVLGISAIFLSAAPLLYPRYYTPLPAAPTLAGMRAYEKSTGAIGTTSFGEYLPIWVQQIPRESPLEAMYQAGLPIERLNPAYLPVGVKVESAHYGVNQMEFVIDAPQPFQAVFHHFYFPGWQARVDGQLAPLAPVTERGLIGVTLPAGRHQLRLYFAETPIRFWANTISSVALVIITGLIVIGLKSHGLKFQASSPTRRLLPSLAIWLLLLAGLLILTKSLYLDHFDTPLKRVFTGQVVAGVDVPRQINFGHQINILGYDLDVTTIAAGETIELTLYWQARQPLDLNYSALTQLVDDQQHLYAGQDNLHPGNLPTSRWEPWGFVQDSHSLRVPLGTPPGDYFLVAGLYDPATWARLPVLAGGDAGWSDVLAIPLQITRSTHLPNVAELGIVWPVPKQTFEVLETSKVSAIQLLGVTPERESIRPNDFLRVALFWETVAKPTADYQIGLRLVAPDGSITLTQSSQPSFGRYPTSNWQAGEFIRDNHAFWIPPDFPTGMYHLQTKLLDEVGQPLTEWLELGQLPAE
jgi:hypothetical protein